MPLFGQVLQPSSSPISNRSEQRVDERSRRRAGQEDQETKTDQDHDDRKKPPLLVLAKEVPELPSQIRAPLPFSHLLEISHQILPQDCRKYSLTAPARLLGVQ